MYDLFPIEIASSGLNAQRVRMGAIASNLANANSTRSADGAGPYRRRMVRLQAGTLPAFGQAFADALASGRAAEASSGLGGERSRWLAEGHVRGVQVLGIEQDPSERLVYEPQHPDADAKGYVHYPDVSVISEMTDMMMASRNYEANLAVIKNTRDMLNQMLELLKA